MKKIKVENTTVMVNTENKDIELYAIVSDGKDTWHIINENEKVIDTITKDTIINYCKREIELSDICYVSSEIMTDSVWWYMEDNHNLELVDHYCQEWDKFTAWFDYVCIEYLAQEIVAIYKQRLLDFE